MRTARGIETFVTKTDSNYWNYIGVNWGIISNWLIRMMVTCKSANEASWSIKPWGFLNFSFYVYFLEYLSIYSGRDWNLWNIYMLLCSIYIFENIKTGAQKVSKNWINTQKINKIAVRLDSVKSEIVSSFFMCAKIRILGSSLVRLHAPESQSRQRS